MGVDVDDQRAECRESEVKRGLRLALMNLQLPKF